jgi:phosphotransferase system enzyme I (PtsP)
MLDDNAIPSEVRGKIEAGNWAQGALREVIQSHVRQFSDMEDPYLRERATDIRDLGRRLLSAMQQDGAERVPDFPDNTVLIADDLSPAMLGLVPEDKLVGMVSVTGSGSSHAAILARSMGIPTLMGVVELPYTKLDGRQVVVDGYSGRIYVDPTDDLLEAYSSILIEERAIEANLDQLRDLPAETQDGFNQTLWVNTGLTADVERAVKRGAEGIGLYRTEIPFMITMRTLDIGGDKALPYFPIEEENPFLGWRGIRVTLDHPEIFLVQVRAMLRASEGLNNLRIMLPMISSVQEVEAALEQINQAFNELLEEGLDLQKPEIGVMIEVPAAVYQIGRFAPLIDFVSVGSNDLTQYLLAVDRNNPRVADLYTTYHPSVLQALQLIANEAHKYQKQVSICGEMAADPGGALLLMAMGYDVLSMNSTNLPKVKLAIRSVEYKDAALLLGQVMKMDESSDIHLLLRETLQNAGLTQLTRPVIPGND